MAGSRLASTPCIIVCESMNKGKQVFDEQRIARYAQRFPDEYLFNLSLGLHCAEQKRYDEAVDHLDRAVSALKLKVKAGQKLLADNLRLAEIDLAEARELQSSHQLTN